MHVYPEGNLTIFRAAHAYICLAKDCSLTSAELPKNKMDVNTSADLPVLFFNGCQNFS